MEFHLPNEREIKTIRPRVHQLAKPLARARSALFDFHSRHPWPRDHVRFQRQLQFFRAVLFIFPIPHLPLSPCRFFIAASSFTFSQPRQLPPSLSLAFSLSLFLSADQKKKGERIIFLPLPVLSFRVVAILRPSSILRPRTPLLFPPLFSLPTSRRAPSTHSAWTFPSSSSAKYRIPFRIVADSR